MRSCALLFVDAMYTNTNYNELPCWYDKLSTFSYSRNLSSGLEKYDQPEHEKELLINETTKLYCHLQLAEDAIAEHSAKEDLLRQKLIRYNVQTYR